MSSNISQRWLLYEQKDIKQFPYRLYIEENPNDFLILDVQDRWPGPNKKIFCHLQGRCKKEELPLTEPIEDIEINKIQRFEKKLSVVLSRKTKKRCWFIFLTKEYKTKPGEFYNQIFWITQSSAKIRRPGAYIPRVREGIAYEIIIDKRERYPYKFGYAPIRRENLPVGDYALMKQGKIIAVAERKTLDNIKHEIGTYDVLKASLQELSTYPYKAVVLESPYADFINPLKTKPYRATYFAEIISDLFVNFPEVQFVFCDNRKIAQEWVYRWFMRINNQYKNFNHE